MGGEGTDPAGGHEHGEPDVNGETRDQETHGGPGPTGAHAERAGAAGGAGGERTAGQADLLGEMKALRRQARAARHAYWFPLVLFGLLTCASVPFYTVPGYQAAGPDPPRPGPRSPCLADSLASWCTATWGITGWPRCWPAFS